MKFHDLPVGQQFEFEGEVYVKTGPFVANHGSSGRQKFMARYAVVKISGRATAPEPRSPRRMVQAGTVEAAFEAFYEKCGEALTGLDLPGDKLEGARAQLAEARTAFLDALNA
jgi:hypothetical protein